MDVTDYPYYLMWDCLKGWILQSIRHDVQSTIDYEKYGQGEDPEYIRGYTDCDIFLYHFMEILDEDPLAMILNPDGIDKMLVTNYEDFQTLKDKFFEEYLTERGEEECIE